MTRNARAIAGVICALVPWAAAASGQSALFGTDDPRPGAQPETRPTAGAKPSTPPKVSARAEPAGTPATARGADDVDYRRFAVAVAVAREARAKVVRAANATFTAAAGDALKALRAQRKARFDEAVAAYDARIRQVTRTGDLDGALAVRAEKEAFVRDAASADAALAKEWEGRPDDAPPPDAALPSSPRVAAPAVDATTFAGVWHGRWHHGGDGTTYRFVGDKFTSSGGASARFKVDAGAVTIDCAVAQPGITNYDRFTPAGRDQLLLESWASAEAFRKGGPPRDYGVATRVRVP